GSWENPYFTDESRHAQYSSLTVECMESLTNLAALEYLYLPGWLVTSDTFDVIESLPNLNEFHAAFSNLDAKTIRRLGKLKQIKKASIGLSSLKPKKLEALGTLTSIKSITIHLFDEDCHLENLDGEYGYMEDSKPDEAAIKRRDEARQKALESIQSTMPWCDVKVLFLPQCFPDEDDPGFDEF
ncbi:MAG: hypothetical protein AAF497_29095, partial [Planctomycetota bacterium]